MKKIITVTLSPALDIEYLSEGAGEFVRAYSHSVSAGGKGINVSRAVKRLIDSYSLWESVRLITVYPFGGDVGEMFSSVLAREGIPSEFAFRIEASTRVNVSLIPDCGNGIEINSSGAALGGVLNEIEAAVLSLIDEGDVVCVCGSVPSDVEKSYPAVLCRKIRECGGIAVLDCDGIALRLAADCSSGGTADLIKPNLSELCGLLGEKISPSEILEARVLEKVRALPFSAVIVTLAENGAVYIDSEKAFFVACDKKKANRLKGAGDSFLGAYVFAKYIRGLCVEESMEEAAAYAGAYVAGE